MIKLLIGGSPCKKWSCSQKKDREIKAKGIGWELFKNYKIARDRFCPDFFLYENNKSAAQAIKDQISRELGVNIVHINSSLVSAQNRERFYAFNWEVDQPEDRGILLRHIIETPAADVRGCARRGRLSDGRWVQITEYREDEKANALTTAEKDSMVFCDGVLRNLTVTECHRLQTLPDGYCDCIVKSKQREAIGNGWTAEVIIHILNGALGIVPRDEEIVVLSMYDGIATGRYCLDKMGFTNVTYYAYEIDPYAIAVAKNNYPDIIHLGDAFDVRKPDWFLSWAD